MKDILFKCILSIFVLCIGCSSNEQQKEDLPSFKPIKIYVNLFPLPPEKYYFNGDLKKVEAFDIDNQQLISVEYNKNNKPSMISFPMGDYQYIYENKDKTVHVFNKNKKLSTLIYNDNRQLIHYKEIGTDHKTIRSQNDYTYDKNGNITTITIYIIDTANKLTKTETKLYKYDAEGRLTEEITNNGAKKINYTYALKDKVLNLHTVEVFNGKKAEYDDYYNAANRRFKSTSPYFRNSVQNEVSYIKDKHDNIIQIITRNSGKLIKIENRIFYYKDGSVSKGEPVQ